MKNETNNKFISLAVRQNLLLWKISKDFVELDNKIENSIKDTNPLNAKTKVLKKIFKQKE